VYTAFVLVVLPIFCCSKNKLLLHALREHFFAHKWALGLSSQYSQQSQRIGLRTVIKLLDMSSQNKSAMVQTAATPFLEKVRNVGVHVHMNSYFSSSRLLQYYHAPVCVMQLLRYYRKVRPSTFIGSSTGSLPHTITQCRFH